METQQMTDKDIRVSIRAHCTGRNGKVVLEEVKRSTGHMKPERWADMVIISFYPSSAITLTGIEIKTSRTDLLAELREPDKTNALKQFCDYWVLAVPAEADILKGRIAIPDDWGIWYFWRSTIETAPPTLSVKRKPKQLYPKAPDRYVFASVVRNAMGYEGPKP